MIFAKFGIFVICVVYRLVIFFPWLLSICSQSTFSKIRHFISSPNFPVGRCGSKYIGQRWFQQANRKVDVVVLVQETSMLQRYAEQLPIYLNNVVQDLDPSKYSFKFGVMAYGGRLSHEHPHAITLDGQLMNDLPSVERAFEHLKFAGVESQNDSSDALAAIAKAAYIYPFRPGKLKHEQVIVYRDVLS